MQTMNRAKALGTYGLQGLRLYAKSKGKIQKVQLNKMSQLSQTQLRETKINHSEVGGQRPASEAPFSSLFCS